MWSENTSILSTPYLLCVLREDPSEPDQFLGPSGLLNCLFSDCKKLDTIMSLHSHNTIMFQIKLIFTDVS